MKNYLEKTGKRQIPSMRTLVCEKDYCDLLYAWLQCNSERANPIAAQRKIEKRKVKYVQIERDFTRKVGNEEEKVMSKYSIAKYFKKLIEWGLIYEDENDPNFYYITVLDAEDANLIEYKTLTVLMSVMQKRSISIYVYLYNRFFANACQPYKLLLSSVKDYIGIASTTTSNNCAIVDTFNILKRLDLLDYELVWENDKSFYQVNWVRNQLIGYEWN